VRLRGHGRNVARQSGKIICSACRVRSSLRRRSACVPFDTPTFTGRGPGCPAGLPYRPEPSGSPSSVGREAVVIRSRTAAASVGWPSTSRVSARLIRMVAVVGWSGSRLASVTARARWRRGPGVGGAAERGEVVQPEGGGGVAGAEGGLGEPARCATGRAPVCRRVAPSVTARPVRWLAVVGTRSARGRHVAWPGPPPVAELGRPRAVFASEDRALTFARFVTSSSGQFGCTDSRPRQGWPLRRAPTAARPCLLRRRIRDVWTAAKPCTAMRRDACKRLIRRRRAIGRRSMRSACVGPVGTTAPARGSSAGRRGACVRLESRQLRPM
jgi:hypothetical protein